MSKLLFALALIAGTSQAQSSDSSLTVVVTDSTGRPVPYAEVRLAAGAPRVADVSGQVVFRASHSDSIRVLVRRIGFLPFEGWLRSADDGRYAATLKPLPQNLARVDIFERDTPLARTGFYDRAQRVQRGAISAWFMTPEQLDQRNAAQVSHLLGGQQYVKIQWYAGRPVLTGRSGNCQMIVLLDGVRLSGMLEEAYTPDGQREIARLGGGERGYQQFMSVRTSIDDIVTAMSIVAVEVYANAASAPVELQRASGSAACGLIALWTGGRR